MASLGRLRPLDSRETSFLIPLQTLSLLGARPLLYYLAFLATHPQGDLDGLGLLDLPPFGWSTGFFAIPLTWGLQPFLRAKPADDLFSSLWSLIDRPPSLALVLDLTLRARPEGRLMRANFLQLDIYISLDPVPGALPQKHSRPHTEIEDTKSPCLRLRSSTMLPGCLPKAKPGR